MASMSLPRAGVSTPPVARPNAGVHRPRGWSQFCRGLWAASGRHVLVLRLRGDRRIGRILGIAAIAQRRRHRRDSDLAVAAIEIGTFPFRVVVLMAGLHQTVSFLLGFFGLTRRGGKRAKERRPTPYLG